MSDLNYNISANVTGTDDVEGLRDDIQEITEDVDTLNASTTTVAVETTGTDTAKTDLGEVGTASEEIGTKAESGATVLGDAMGAIIDGVTGAKDPMDAAGDVAGELGTQMEGAGGKAGIFATVLSGIGAAISIGAAAWSAFSQRQKEATQTTADVSEAINENVGALGQMKAALDDLIDSGDFTGFDQINQQLLDQDPEAFQQAAQNLGVLGGSYRDVADTIAGLQTDEIATLNNLIAQSGIPPELAASALELVQAGGDLSYSNNRLSASTSQLGQDVNTLRAEYGEQIDALVGVRAAQDDLDIEGVAQSYLDAQGGVEGYAEMLERAKAAAGPDASTIDVFNEFVSLQAQAAQDAGVLADQQEEAAQGARDLASAMQSVDWQQTEIEGATSAMSEFTATLFAGSNQIQAQEEAASRLETAMEGVGLTFDLTTTAGRAQNDALESVAAVIDTQLVEAYDRANGSQSEFVAQATQIGEDTLAMLAERLGLTTEEVEVLRGALGLTAADYEARFELAGVAEAQLQLGLMQASIAGLPPTVESQVNLLILQGDYVGARDTILAYYDGNPVPIPTELVPPPFNEADLAALVGVADVEITTSQDGVAFDEIDDLVDDERTATVNTEADLSGVTDIDNAVAEQRTAVVDVDADLSDYESEMTFAIRRRTTTVDVATGTIDMPSNSQLRNMIGTIRVPVTLYYNRRIEGSRPGP